MKYHFIIFIGFLLLLIISGLSQNNNLEKINQFYTLFFLDDSSVKEEAEQIKETCGNENNNLGKITCYSKEFENLAYKNDPEYAFDILFALQKQDEVAKVCHLIAHGIGWGTYDRNPDDWQNQIASISPICVYGGLHGILEQYIYNLPEGKLTKEVITDICKSNPKPGCIHAVGHLTTVETEDDLNTSIELCSAFPKANYQHHHCLTGAFMEHMIASNLVEHGYYPQSRREKWYTLIDDFEKLCRSYNGENATACWTEIIHASAIKFQGNPEKIFDYCNTAQLQEARKRCRRHAIAEIMPKHNYNISSLKYMCAIEQANDTTFERDCYLNLAAIRLFHAEPKEAVDVVDFCLSLDLKYQNSCFLRIGGMLKELSVSKDEASYVCKNAPIEFKDKCLGKS